MFRSRGRLRICVGLTLLATGVVPFAAAQTPESTAPPLAPIAPIAPVALAATASSAPGLAETSAVAAVLPYTPSLEPAFMDRSIDPCVDFYAYSCNGWRAQNPIPPDKSRWSVYGKLYHDNQQFLRGLLEEAAQGSEASSPELRKLGDYFAACMDLAAIDDAGLDPIRADMKEIGALKDAAALSPLLGRLHLQGGGRGLLFGFGTEQDPGDATQRIAVVRAGGLGLPDRDYYLKADPESAALRAKYIEHLARNFSQMGETKEWAAESAAIVLEIETELARASLSRVDRRDPRKVYHRMNLAALQKLTPVFPWRSYFEAAGISPPGPVSSST